MRSDRSPSPFFSPPHSLSLSLPGAGGIVGVLAFTHCKHGTRWAQQGASGSRADGLWSSEGALCGSTIMVAPAGGGNRRAFRGGEVTAWPLATPLHSPRKFAANRGSVCSSHCLVWRLSLAGITGSLTTARSCTERVRGGRRNEGRATGARR